LWSRSDEERRNSGDLNPSSGIPPFYSFSVHPVTELSFLENVPIFADLEEPELKTIEKLGLRKKYKKGNIVVLEKEMGAALFVIISGKVKIVRTDEDGREVILSIFGPGEFFGEMSLLDGLARSASVVALAKAELFMIHRRDFLKLLHEHPQVAISLLGELTTRLRKADTQIKSLSLKDASGRVANVILMLADDIGVFRKGKVEIDELPLQQDMANMAGTSRETVSRMIHQFIREGHLQLEGNKLTINDYEEFRKQYL
jgi:CRP/FNR family cyclic AMP-dependent transcriptional regulator